MPGFCAACTGVDEVDGKDGGGGVFRTRFTCQVLEWPVLKPIKEGTTATLLYVIARVLKQFRRYAEFAGKTVRLCAITALKTAAPSHYDR